MQWYLAVVFICISLWSSVGIQLPQHLLLKRLLFLLNRPGTFVQNQLWVYFESHFYLEASISLG